MRGVFPEDVPVLIDVASLSADFDVIVGSPTRVVVLVLVSE